MNKKLMLPAVLLLVVFSSYTQEYKNLVFSSAKPKPGDVVKFEYSVAGTMLGGIKDFEAIAYISDGEVRAQEVTLMPKGDKWTGQVNTNDSTKAVFIVFKKDKLVDNNKEQGYSLMMYKNNEPVKGAYAAIADVNAVIGSYVMQLKTDPKNNLALFDKEFKRNPGLQSKFLLTYTNQLVQVDKATAKEKIKPLIDEIIAGKNITEPDYQNIMWSWQRVGEKETAEKLSKDIVKKFPDGEQAKTERLRKVYDESDLNKKDSLMTAYNNTYPPTTEATKKNLDSRNAYMARMAGNKKDWDMFRKYEALVVNKESLAGSYNSIAWGLSGESLEADADASDLAMAKELSAKSLQYAKQSMDNGTNKPTYYTAKEYKKDLQYSYGTYEDTYALILWKSGDHDNACKYQEEAITNMNKSDAEANERFIIYKEKLKGPASVKADIIEYVKEGKSSSKLKDILKKAFISEGHNEAEFAAYLEGLMGEYYTKLKEELMKKMINEAAPKFALKDLSGNTVSLEQLKGKVVVVDFWATWCGPCKASFPGMQIALNKYKNDPDVKFVFVDTWESKKPEEMQKNADQFITKSKYDFHVLLDTEDKVVSSYAVEGIPTKFVIDTENKIRFKAVGYDGSSDKLVDEISIMVNVLKPGGENGIKKGF